MFSIKEVYIQALEDKTAIHQVLQNGESIINMGVKIQKFNDYIEILNCSKGGDYFSSFNDEEYKIILKEGWKVGCIKTAMNNCLHKLNLIESKMKIEVNTRKNDKHIQNLKNRRESILIKYSKHNNKLIKIKSNGKQKHLQSPS
jgi:hypothetical protein|tara:strand:- start:13581 stop:14012 length:432 start_codon:yes stop_codon:yes gene_type:complete